MVSKELLDYAIKGIQKGMSLSEIKSKLLSHGWGEAEINEAIGLASNPSLGKPSIDNSLINYIKIQFFFRQTSVLNQYSFFLVSICL